MKKSMVIGTRGSALALTQTNVVKEHIQKYCPDLEIEIKIIKTTGDKILDKSLSKIGGKGLFVLEIESALRNGEIDLAVHSMKDVPNVVPDEFAIVAVLDREDPRDVLISKDGLLLSELPIGAAVGTSSLRRVAQIRNLRPDLNFKPLRGNIDTRIKKMMNGEVDAIILAAAGLKRMGWQDKITQYLDVNDCIPSVGQGALCIEFRKADLQLRDILSNIVNEKDFKCVLSERAFLKEMNGDCSIAIGAHAVIKDASIFLEGFVCSKDGTKLFADREAGSLSQYEEIGMKLGKKLKVYRE
ncbi:MAG: hydroxymethylbilane synthase [Bacillota bacterium]|nr:hydroxymethylbilane synthase [Bacillota bacterium]